MLPKTIYYFMRIRMREDSIEALLAFYYMTKKFLEKKFQKRLKMSDIKTNTADADFCIEFNSIHNFQMIKKHIIDFLNLKRAVLLSISYYDIDYINNYFVTNYLSSDKKYYIINIASNSLEFYKEQSQFLQNDLFKKAFFQTFNIGSKIRLIKAIKRNGLIFGGKRFAKKLQRAGILVGLCTRSSYEKSKGKESIFFVKEEICV